MLACSFCRIKIRIGDLVQISTLNGKDVLTKHAYCDNDKLTTENNTNLNWDPFNIICMICKSYIYQNEYIRPQRDERGNVKWVHRECWTNFIRIVINNNLNKLS